MPEKVPKHLAVIMDGSRRWAKKNGVSTLEGHRAGYEKVKQLRQWCLDKGIAIITVFAFSAENWTRPKREIRYLLGLLKYALRKEVDEFNKYNIRLNVIGRIKEFPKGLQKEINLAIAKTKNNTKILFNLALNYGGRAEIVDAVKEILQEKLPINKMTEAVLAKHLYEPALPDPDLIIRTSGEQRLSGFMLWESAYSELYFSKKYWPDFSKEDFDAALKDFSERTRNFGQ